MKRTCLSVVHRRAAWEAVVFIGTAFRVNTNDRNKRQEISYFASEMRGATQKGVGVVGRSGRTDPGETDMPSSLQFSRRHLLAMGAAAPLVLSASRGRTQEAVGQPLIGDPPLPEPFEQRMRWAVVGLGTFAIGQVIPGFLMASRSRMTAFVSGNAEKARDVGARYGVDRFYSYADYDRMADDAEIDCVYIALPTGLHAEYAIRALDAGKHVLCEKPMATSAAECEAMIAAARRNDRRLGVAYRVHFEPTNLEAKRRIDGGALGTLRHIRCEHGYNSNPDYPPHKWRLDKALAGGGSMFDIGIYGLNTALMMLGDDAPVSVSAVHAFPRTRSALSGGRGRPRLAAGDSGRHERQRVEFVQL